MNNYDLAIIGSGPCGYVAAIRAAQLGLKTCIFEADKIGGVCLNYGCIPTKALSASSKALYDVKHASIFGINVKDYSMDFPKMFERKEAIVKKLSSGIEMLMKARKIEIIREKAEIKDAVHIKTRALEIEAKNILIASGSVPFELAGLPFDNINILSSSDMLALNEIPKSIVIVGGGFIGCEFASIFRALGADISIVEMTGHLLPNEDEEIARKLEALFKKQGIRIFTGTKVEKINKKENSTEAFLSDGSSVFGEKTLICVGRAPNSKGFGIESLNIDNNKGWIKVDEHFRTNIKNIYAAGDVKGGILLAHVASKEGISAVEYICGNQYNVDYNAVPSCVFTRPEIASVGLNEKSARSKGLEVCVRKFLFSAIGKSHILDDIDGFIKLVVDNKSDKILGAQIIGPGATELIAELSLCVQFGITSENLAKVIHAHPTLSEVICEASESVHNKAIHSL